MKMEVFADADEVARKAADFIVSEAEAAVAARGRFVMALSGGSTPRLMLRYLVEGAMPWDRTYVVQVDERVAPAGHPDRNLSYLQEILLENPATLPAQSASRLLPERIYPMPVADRDLAAAAGRYSEELRRIAGSPPMIDLIHLGLGTDGHTASLIPEDPALGITDTDVAVTRVYQGRIRMTLTYPVIDRSRRILWLVTGAGKAAALARLRAGDPSIPAGRVEQSSAVIFADRQAAREVEDAPR